MKVKFSAAAREDLIEIGDYIAGDSRAAARRYVAASKAQCRILDRFPNRSPACPEYGSGLRRTTFRSHYIYYSVRPAAVLIEHIVHTARDPANVFGLLS